MKQKWIDTITWACLQHIPAAKLPANCEKCWFCKAQRPPLPNGQQLPPPRPRLSDPPRPLPKKRKPSFTSVAETGSVPAKCAWHDCVKTAAPSSKYCSRNCSNKNARARHKAAKATTPPAAAE
jgi:hypothetical protein